jgi:hypothetical protein
VGDLLLTKPPNPQSDILEMEEGWVIGCQILVSGGQGIIQLPTQGLLYNWL